MSLKLQIILIVLWCLFFLYLVSQMKKKRLEIRYTLPWLLLDIVLLIISIFPNILVFVTTKLGIVTPANMVFFVGFVFALIIIYTLTISLSHISDNVRSLTQRVALSEYAAKKNDEDSENES